MNGSVVERRPVSSFFAAMFAWSWGYWALVGAAVDAESVSFLLPMPGLWGPAVSAVAVTWASGESVRDFLRRVLRTPARARWFALAVVGPAALSVVGAAVRIGLAGTGLELTVLRPVVAVTVALFAGGSEEIGLRGFAHPRLRQRYGGLHSGALIGVVWAVWHLPLHGLGVGFDGSFLLFAGSVVPISVLLGWLHDASGASVLPAVVAHAGFDAPALVSAVGQIPADAVFASRLTLLAAYWLLVAGLVAKNGSRLTSSSSLPAPVRGPVESTGDEDS